MIQTCWYRPTNGCISFEGKHIVPKMRKLRKLVRSWRIYVLVVLTTVPLVLVYFLTTSYSDANVQATFRRDTYTHVFDNTTRQDHGPYHDPGTSGLQQSEHQLNISSHSQVANSTSNKTIHSQNGLTSLNSSKPNQVGELNQEKLAGILNRSRVLRESLQRVDAANKTGQQWVVNTHDADGNKQKQDHRCPLWPKELVGRIKASPDMKLSTVQLTESQKRRVKPGGKVIPDGCLPREKTAVIIPYRDREEHLEIVIHHLHGILQRQKIQYAIYVIELAYPTQFNRGLLANAGFLSASSVDRYSCFVIHDVDMIAADDRNMYRCGRHPRHLVGSNSKYKDGIPYLGYFGAVNAFTGHQFWSLNGFSNLYFGWGGEDDDMVYRMIGHKMHFSRPSKQIGAYIALNHEHDSSNPRNPNRIQLVKTASNRSLTDGVKDMFYTRIAMEFRPLYTWVLVSANEAKYMEKFKDYL